MNGPGRARARVVVGRSTLHVERLGSGPPVLFVHGSVGGGESTWSEQQPLAERWTLLLLDRPGYGSNPPVEREDFDVDAGHVAELLGDGVHLVGQSYGGVVSLLAAARRPEAVRSLTVIEPPAFAVAAGRPEVDELVARLRGALGARAARAGRVLTRLPRARRLGPPPARSAHAEPPARRRDPPPRARPVGGRDPTRRARPRALPQARRLGWTPRGIRRGLRRSGRQAGSGARRHPGRRPQRPAHRSRVKRAARGVPTRCRSGLATAVADRLAEESALELEPAAPAGRRKLVHVDEHRAAEDGPAEDGEESEGERDVRGGHGRVIGGAPSKP